MKNKCAITIVLLISGYYADAQTGGKYVFSFLNLPPSAQVTALGGLNVTQWSEDPSAAYQNPAMLNSRMNNKLSLNTVNYLGDIGYSHVGFARRFDSLQTNFYASVHTINYGDFLLTNSFGGLEGDFKANEFAATGGFSRLLSEKVMYGLNVTFISSRLESYSSSGLAATAGIAYVDSANDFIMALVAKNMGGQLNGYTAGASESLPFDLQLGISKRLTHTPFQFSLTLHDLHEFDIRYNDPDEVSTVFLFDTSQVQKDPSYLFDKIFLHAILSTEIFIGRNLKFTIGYNHQRRQELAISTRKGLAGFSYGAQIRINRFYLGYGRAIYNVAGNTSHFSLGFNLDELFVNW